VGNWWLLGWEAARVIVGRANQKHCDGSAKMFESGWTGESDIKTILLLLPSSDAAAFLTIK
jgi:hypothetical protein